MANRRIKVEGVADFSAIRKEVQNLNNTITGAFGKNGAKILDEKSVLFLKKESQAAFDKMHQTMGKLRQEAEQLNSQLKNTSAESKQHEEISKRVVENLKAQVAVEKEISNLKRSQNIIETGYTPEAQAKAAAVASKKLQAEERKAKQAATVEEKKREKERLQEQRRLMAEGKAQVKDRAKQERQDTKVLSLNKKLEAKKFADEERAKARGLRDEGHQRGYVQNQIMSGVGDVAGSLPGIGQAAQVPMAGVQAGSSAAAMGMSAGAIVGLAALATAAAAAAFAISRMVSGFEVFKQAIPNMLSISGMGAKPLTDGRTIGGAAQLGYGQLEVLEIQKQMEQSLGKAGSGRQNQNRMLNILTAARDTGMSPQEILGGADQLRRVGGTEVAQKQISMILEKAITSGMDKTQASHFLNAAVGLLTEINQHGVANTSAMLGVMSDLVAKGKMSPEQAAKSLSGINAAIAGSSGESNAFFQNAAARSGLGGGTILGAHFAVRQGLAGVNMGALQNQIGDTGMGRMGIQSIQEMGLGDPNFTQKFAEGILGDIKQRFNTDSKEGRSATLGFVGSMFGAKSAPESAKILALLEKMAKPGVTLSKEDKRLLEDLGKDPEQSWRERTLANLDVTARSTAASLAFLEKGQFELGRASSGLIAELNGYLARLDGTIAKFLSSDTFKAIMDGVRETSGMIGKIMGGAFTDIMKVPDALKGVLDKLLGSPGEFGKAMGKGFSEVVMTVWDMILKGWTKLIELIQNPAKLLSMGDKAWDEVKDITKDAYDGVSKFLGGVSSGFKEGMANNGKVSYTDQEKAMLGDVKDLATGLATPSTMHLRAGSEFLNSRMAEPVQAGPTKTDPVTQAPIQTAMQTATDTSELVNESKKQTQLLNKIANGGVGAPRAGREKSRP